MAGGLVQGPLSGNPDMLEYGMRRTPSERLMNVPRNPVLGGQQHMLAYITPEEASTLREQGGGVTPTGGQYRGPGGIASFWAPGVPGAAAAAAAAAAAGQAPGGGGGSEGFGYSPAQYGLQAPPHGYATPQGYMSPKGTPRHAEQVTKAQIDEMGDLSKKIRDFNLKAHVDNESNEIAQLNPLTQQKEISDRLQGLRDSLSDFGLAQGEVSKHNLTTKHFMSDIFGESKGWFDTKGNYFSNAEIDAMTPAQFSKLSLAGPKGDPNSPFGKAVVGLAPALMSLVAPALSPAMSLMGLAYDAANPNSPSFGLMGLAEQAGLDFSAVTAPIGDALSFAADALGSTSVDPTAPRSSQQGLNTNRSTIGDTSTVTGQDIGQALSGYASDVSGFFSPIGESLGMTGAEPSEFSVNPGGMGPGLPQASLPPPAVPPLLQEDPLGTEMPEDWRGHTIEELSKLTTPLPPTTSIFARGGFVDKPLYSRS